MKCLSSLSIIKREWELILVTNGRELSPGVLDFARTLTPFFKLIQTESLLKPGKARNLALHEVTSPWIFFLDDDAYIPESYWNVLWPLLDETKIDVLGGPDSPADGMNNLSLSLALALSSPFCTGPTFYRHRSYGRSLQYADEEMLTSCNLWVRTSSRGSVEFPEDFIRAEENVFLSRLKSKGAGMFYHPKLKVQHYRREKLKEFLRPTYCAGVYRAKLMKRATKRNNLFWLPAIFVLLHLLVFVEPHLFLYLARMYVGLVVFISISICMRKRRPNLFLLVAFFHYFVVFLYGVGFLSEKFFPLTKKEKAS